METSKLRKFASFARSSLIEQVGTRLKTVLAAKSMARRESPYCVEELEKKIKDLGDKLVVEMVAYTWFNRFCALRYMDVNRYTRIGVLSPADGQFQPEILAEAKMGHIDEELVPETTRKKVMRLLDGSDPSADPQSEAYRLLLVAVCNYYHSLMPFMFEKIADYTELLLPDDLLSGTSIPAYTREALLPINCSPEHTEESVEVIGWLYQFYIADKKDEVFEGLKKGKKVTPENIPAATQLFTPHWIVRYLVENSLGRLWMLNHPNSKLIERMEYYIKPEPSDDTGITEPPMWQPSWKEYFSMKDGRTQESMWLRPNPALRGNYQEAMHYALSVDGTACAKELWFGGEELSEASWRWDRDGYTECSFKQLRAALFFFQRNARWNDSDPGDNLDDPFWRCFERLLIAWDREWRDHINELANLPKEIAATDRASPGQAKDFLRINSPEEIKVCDPACGSGHMLTYAFDLLYEIYREEQYPEPEIPTRILKNNLFGIEIDPRAGALAAFALTMKSREKDKRFFTRKSESDASAIESHSTKKSSIPNPNICVLENVDIDPQDLADYMDTVGRDLFTGGLEKVLGQFKEADNFGSLIRPTVTNVSDVLEVLRERKMDQELLLVRIHHQVLVALRQADYLSPKYHVVVANPPYMGGKGMNARIKEFLEANFNDVKSDLFSAFIVRNTELALNRGQLGFMSPFVWMFLASYEDLRSYLIHKTTITSLIQLEYSGFDGATVPICTFTLENHTRPDYEGAYVRLSEFRGAENQGPKTLEAIQNPSCTWFYRTASKEFERIPGRPIAYWVNNRVRRLFEELPQLSGSMNITGGMTTADNDRFVRLWHEVSLEKAFLLCESREEATKSGKKWFPYNKGGSYRKWYGNREHFVNWFKDGEEIQSTGRAFPRSKDCYFKESLTYTATSSSYFGIRYCPPGAIFDAKGSSCFAEHPTLINGLGFLASELASYLLAAINPTIEFQTGNLSVLPFSPGFNVISQVNELIEIARDDWDSYEVSWDFCRPAVLTTQPSLRICYRELRNRWGDQTNRMVELERSNIQSLAHAYGLNGEVNTEPSIDSITLKCNPVYRYGNDKSDSEREAFLLADTMQEFISYAVGCMFGRYSLDKAGLILSNQGDTTADYLKQIPAPTFTPDVDNVIPITEREWFNDDIAERFKEFLKTSFGNEHYGENLDFLEDALYPDNATAKKRKSIRDYFLKEFYDHHLKMYKKRPIYWLFSSPKGTFNALIYMHRYRPDTVSTVLNYLRDFRDKLFHHSEHQQMVADSGSATKSEKTAAIKEVAVIKKQLKELEEYEKDLFDVASKKIEIDLDSGVKHNYPLFGSVLKKIAGLDAKED